MEYLYLRLGETILIIVLYFIVKNLAFRLINKTLSEQVLQESRGVLIRRAIHVIVFSIAVIFVMLIWGVKQADLGVFVGSVLTVVGVAFFAQWSILSNITASIILFFNHPIRMNDSISILEGKDYVLEGRVTNIGLFFVTLQTADEEEITLPNNTFIQKSIRKISAPPSNSIANHSSVA